VLSLEGRVGAIQADLGAQNALLADINARLPPPPHPLHHPAAAAAAAAAPDGGGPMDFVRQINAGIFPGGAEPAPAPAPASAGAAAAAAAAAAGGGASPLFSRQTNRARRGEAAGGGGAAAAASADGFDSCHPRCSAVSGLMRLACLRGVGADANERGASVQLTGAMLSHTGRWPMQPQTGALHRTRADPNLEPRESTTEPAQHYSVSPLGPAQAQRAFIAPAPCRLGPRRDPSRAGSSPAVTRAVPARPHHHASAAMAAPAALPHPTRRPPRAPSESTRAPPAASAAPCAQP
jgi:hypothetical protein